jgi:hypothetical protein
VYAPHKFPLPIYSYYYTIQQQLVHVTFCLLETGISFDSFMDFHRFLFIWLSLSSCYFSQSCRGKGKGKGKVIPVIFD